MGRLSGQEQACHAGGTARITGQLKGTGERGGPQSGHCKGFRCYFEGDGEPLEGLSRGASWSNCHLEEWLSAKWGRDAL